MTLDRNTSPNSRNAGIDGLRGASILSVILLHCYIHMPLSTTLPIRLTNIIFRSGYYGVMFFFVISGFLITTTSLRKWGSLANISCSQFYRMRFARIFPCLILLLSILSILHTFDVSGFTIHTTTLSQAIFATLTFHINWLEAKTGYLPGNWDVLWSLSIEEMFYLFFPIICILFKKPSHLLALLFLFIILGPFARVAFTTNDIWSDHSYLSGMDGIAIGCIAALFAYYYKLTRNSFLIILGLGLCCFNFIFFFRKQAYDLGISQLGLNVTILEVGAALLLIAAQAWYGKGKQHARKWTMVLRWLGKYSYEVYLTHMFVVIAVAHFLYHPAQSNFRIILSYIFVIVMAGLIGQLIAHFYSEPLNRLLRKKNDLLPLQQANSATLY